MEQRNPNIVTSGLSRIISDQGVKVELAIYRLEDDPSWTLEVVNEAGTSTVWDDQFPTDGEAFATFRDTVAEEGMRTFLDRATVIPFRR